MNLEDVLRTYPLNPIERTEIQPFIVNEQPQHTITTLDMPEPSAVLGLSKSIPAQTTSALPN